MIDVLLGAHLKRCKVVRIQRVAMVSNQTQAGASVKMVDAGGGPWTMSGVVHQSEHGPVGLVLIFLLTAAARFDEADNIVTGDQSSRPLATIRANRDRLENIGIKSVMLGPNRCVTWSDLEGILQQKESAKSPVLSKTRRGNAQGG
jgi:hypothetical protein